MNNAIISTDDFLTKQLSMKRRVLIVDDEEINRLMLKNTLDDDYTVLLAQNGREAYDIVKNENGRLSLILLDLHMPVMDGYEFYDLLQKDKEFAKIPVIVLTSEKEAEVKSLKMGVADFIPKPYDVPEVIQARIDRIIQLYEDKNIITSTQFDPLTGLFNAYNATGAIALALELGIADIQKNLKTFRVAFGRSEVKSLEGKRTLIQLIKNPVGANEVLKTVDADSNLLIAINDNYADGRDISWLWDAEFEFLKKVKKEIVVSGTRANDMALRLKYAGINTKNIKIIGDIKKAVDYIGKSADNNITILPTYTALLKLNKIKKLKKV